MPKYTRKPPTFSSARWDGTIAGAAEVTTALGLHACIDTATARLMVGSGQHAFTMDAGDTVIFDNCASVKFVGNAASLTQCFDLVANEEVVADTSVVGK